MLGQAGRIGPQVGREQHLGAGWVFPGAEQMGEQQHVGTGWAGRVKIGIMGW